MFTLKFILITNFFFCWELIGSEKVYIPKDKPYIFMRGNGKGRTHIVWSQSSADNIESATFRVEAPHFVAFGISFKVQNFHCQEFILFLDRAFR